MKARKMACIYCAEIPLEIFDLTGNATASHVFHPSLISLKISAESGCHPCILIYQRIISSNNSRISDVKSGTEYGDPVILRHRRRGSLHETVRVEVQCGDIVEEVLFNVDTGLPGKYSRKNFKQES